MLRRIMLFMALAALMVGMVASNAAAAKRFHYCTSDSLPPFSKHCAPTKKKCNAIVRANPDFTKCHRERR